MSTWNRTRQQLPLPETMLHFRAAIPHLVITVAVARRKPHLPASLWVLVTASVV